MSEFTITIKTGEGNIDFLSQAIKKIPKSTKILIFEINESVFIKPAFLGYLCLVIISYQAENITVRVDCEKNNYLARMDLFKACNMNYEELFNRYNESGRFLPLLTIKSSNDIKIAVDAICNMVAQKIPNSNQLMSAYEWSINEVIDNIRNHANSSLPGIVTAQYYPQPDLLYIFVGNFGRGIKKSLSSIYEYEDDVSAILKAIERGVTRDTNIGQGNGLAGTKEILNINGGSLTIYSGKGKVKFQNNRIFQNEFENEVCGTIVEMMFYTKKIVNLDDTFISDNGFTFLTAEAEKFCYGGLIIEDECSWTGGREPAKNLRYKLRAMTEEVSDLNTVISLDFSNVNCSSSFMDELIGKLMLDLGGYHDFFKYFKFQNLGDINNGILVNVLKQRNLISH